MINHHSQLVIYQIIFTKKNEAQLFHVSFKKDECALLDTRRNLSFLVAKMKVW